MIVKAVYEDYTIPQSLQKHMSIVIFFCILLLQVLAILKYIIGH